MLEQAAEEGGTIDGDELTVFVLSSEYDAITIDSYDELNDRSVWRRGHSDRADREREERAGPVALAWRERWPHTFAADGNTEEQPTESL